MGLFSRRDPGPVELPLGQRLPRGFQPLEDDRYELRAVPVDVVLSDDNGIYVLFDNGAYACGYENDAALEHLLVRKAIRDGTTLAVRGDLEETETMGRSVPGVSIDEFV